MRIIHDTDTIEFTDDSGDKLILRSMPRQRDVLESDRVERDAAFVQLRVMKELGIDTDELIAKADPEEVAAARAGADDASPEVRAFRLKALGLRMVVSGTSIGGAAIVEAYSNMDPASAAWVDAKVAEVWAGASLSDADTRPQSVDAGLSVVTGG